MITGPAIAAALLIDPGAHSVFGGASTQASHIEWLYWLIFWICFVVYVLMIISFTRAGSRNYRNEPEMLPVLPKDEPGDRRAGFFVGTAVAVTVLTLFFILFASVITGKKVESSTTSKNPVTINVIGHQWWWEVIYPNTQADQTVTSANEIHVPVGKPVVILTNSADVIHSFWPPSIDGKRDLLPGYSSAFWFQVDKPGIYRGQCAEFCGLQHAHMGFSIIAESPEQFAQWQQNQVKPAGDSPDPEAQRGKQVFLTHACIMCHTIRGTDAGSRFGPDLTHVASRQMIAAETLPNNRGALAGWIVDPQRIKPGNQMAPNPLAPDDLQAVVTYLQTLQ